MPVISELRLLHDLLRLRQRLRRVRRLGLISVACWIACCCCSCAAMAAISSSVFMHRIGMPFTSPRISTVRSQLNLRSLARIDVRDRLHCFEVRRMPTPSSARMARSSGDEYSILRPPRAISSSGGAGMRPAWKWISSSRSMIGPRSSDCWRRLWGRAARPSPAHAQELPSPSFAACRSISGTASRGRRG